MLHDGGGFDLTREDAGAKLGVVGGLGRGHAAPPVVTAP